MTTIRLVDTPKELVDIGVSGGNWLRFDDADAHALLFWRGGPKSADKEVILHWIEANPPRRGHGTELLRQILWWCDRYELTVRLFCQPALAEWYGRHGFITAGPYNEGLDMRRAPRAARSGLIVPKIEVR